MVKDSYSFSPGAEVGQNPGSDFTEEININATLNKNLKDGKSSDVFTISGENDEKSRSDVDNVNGDIAEIQAYGLNDIKTEEKELNGSSEEAVDLDQIDYSPVATKGEKKDEKEKETNVAFLSLVSKSF